jgi:molybdenum cofactor cytidylyltransferase
MTEPSHTPPSSGRVIALVLAAGASSRFGSDKRQARLPDGRSLLEAVVAIQREVFDEVWVLTRPGDAYAPAVVAASAAPAASAAASDGHVRCVVCDDAADGQGHTVAAGLRLLMALPDEGRPVRGALIALADMPWVQADTLRALRARFDATDRVVLPRHGEALGHPRLLPRAVWAALLGEQGGSGLQGDRGARVLIDWSAAEQVAVDDVGVLRDADTPADLARGARG